VLRKQFEVIADQHEISNDFVTYLETQIEKAPFTYKIIEQQLVSIPVGEIEDVLASLIAFDALTLIAENKLIFLKRCSNPDCVLLFIDKSGKRKWCSMKICGNRKKVAKFQDRKFEEV
ncbi:TPA: CGNR zinc finger domain-containing protein, partial [Bacillus cereus]|nr:CGNR zinc finger domain-containing protein [Bacillus cereus]